MNQQIEERRERQRQSVAQRPLGIMAAMLTASLVTLIGVFSGVEPFDLLIRAMVSAILMGAIVSLGLGVIRVANVRTRN
jgi:hypothetical protein